MTTTNQPTALVTGGSAGLGLALVEALVGSGWHVVTDARDQARLERSVAPLGPAVHAVVGDVTDPRHRAALVAAAGRTGGLDLLVHNASALGPSPLPPLAELALDDLDDVLATNVLAPLALTQATLPLLRAASGTVLAISSDAAVEAYPGWGGYGASKAALDHLVAVLAVEEPAVRWLAVDPGDLRTDMHQRAFPGEDISDRPLPATVVPALLALLSGDQPSGRYRASELTTAGAR